MPRTKMIPDREAIEAIIHRCETCYVGMVDADHKPYVVPFNFAYADHTLYLHSAPDGKKMEILRRDGTVSIAMSTDHELRFQKEDVACSYGMKYRSVILSGKVEFIVEDQSKREVLNLIMKKYTGREFTFGDPAVRNVAVYAVRIDSMSGKESGY